jgi:hypothetical protein
MTTHARPTKEGARRLLDSWQFWVGIAYFGLACVVVALWVNYNRVSRDQVRTAEVVAARHADLVASAEAQYTQCVKSIPTLRNINAFINGVEEVHQILLVNSIAAHKATPPGSALYQQQIMNIARLRDAFATAKNVHFTIASKAKCLATKEKEESHS